MTLADTSHGPDWVLYVITALFIIFSIMLLTGHGGFWIAGYNTMSKKEKEKYDEKKLCRGMGVCMSIIALLLLFTSIFEDKLPAEFANVIGIVIVADVIIMIIVGNIFGKKK